MHLSPFMIAMIAKMQLKLGHGQVITYLCIITEDQSETYMAYNCFMTKLLSSAVISV